MNAAARAVAMASKRSMLPGCVAFRSGSRRLWGCKGVAWAIPHDDRVGTLGGQVKRLDLANLCAGLATISSLSAPAWRLASQSHSR